MCVLGFAQFSHGKKRQNFIWIPLLSTSSMYAISCKCHVINNKDLYNPSCAWHQQRAMCKQSSKMDGVFIAGLVTKILVWLLLINYGGAALLRRTWRGHGDPASILLVVSNCDVNVKSIECALVRRRRLNSLNIAQERAGQGRVIKALVFVWRRSCGQLYCRDTSCLLSASAPSKGCKAESRGAVTRDLWPALATHSIKND